MMNEFILVYNCNTTMNLAKDEYSEYSTRIIIFEWDTVY